MCSHRGPKEGRDTKHAYGLKTNTATIDLPCYEPPHGKTNNLHGRKQRHKADKRLCFRLCRLLISEADKRLCFRYTDSTILLQSEISSL